MKKTIKILPKLVILYLIVLLTNCHKEDVIVTDEANNNKQYSIGKLGDFPTLDSFVREDILKYKADKAQLERTDDEDIYDFTIIDDNIARVEDLGITTYTIKIVKKEQEANSFSNLVVEFRESKNPKAYIINYYPSQNYTENVKTKPDIFFEGDVNMENVDYKSSLDYLFRGTIECTDISYDVCSWSGTIAGNACYSDPDKSDHILTYTITICYEVNPFIDAGDSGGGGDVGDSGGTEGGGGTTSPTTSPTYVSPCEQVSRDSFTSARTETGITDGDGCIMTEEGRARDELYDRLATVLTSQPQADWIANYRDINLIYEFNNYLEDGIYSNIHERQGISVFLIQSLVDFIITQDQVYLTLATFSNDVPWTPNAGEYNGVSSLAYTHTREIISNGRLHYQYKLANGDVLSKSSYPPSAGSSELVEVLFYFNQKTKLWYDFQQPNSYSPLTLDFLWDGFWSSTLTAVRVFTPLEDIIILIDGRDLEGVQQSRAVAGTFILIDIIPGSSVVKGIKLVKYGDEAIDVVNAVRKVADDIYKSQKEIIQDVLGDTDWYQLDLFDNTIRKGNFGEMVTDVDLYELGYNPLHTRVDYIDKPLNQGIDGIFKNPQTGEFIVVETKFGQSGLSTLADGTKQMSEEWIEDRLIQEVGEDLAEEILENGYTSVLSKVSQNGSIQYFTLDSAGNTIGSWTP